MHPPRFRGAGPPCTDVPASALPPTAARAKPIISNNDKLLTPGQAFLMMRMFRQAAMVSKNGIFWRTFGQTLEVVAAISSAIVPVLVALQTQTDKRDDPEWYWGLTGSTVALSVIATICMVVERTRGMKEQGIRERMVGADQLYHLKLFLACSVEDGYTSDYRKSFATLSKRMAKMQFKGTSDVYVPPWPAAAHPARGTP